MIAPHLNTLRSVWSWWTGELATLLPRRLRGGRAADLVVTVDAAGSLLCSGEDGRPVTPRPPALGVLRLPPELVVTRTAVMPAAIEENLHEAIGFQLDRLTPFEPNEVYYGCRVVDRDPAAEAVTVSVALALQADVDALRERAAGAGIICVRVCTPGDAASPSGLSLELGDANAGMERSRRAAALPWVAALLLLIAAVATPLWQGRDRLSALRAEVGDLRRSAQRVASLRSELERRSEAAAIPIRRRARPTFSMLLTELTRLVPDSGWVSQIEIGTGAVQLTGYAAAANALIPVLEASPVFTNAAFRSPVTQDPVHGVEQFHLSIDLRDRSE